MAGRSILAMVRRQKRAMAIRAPVLPAETAASASLFLTASIASHIEDFQRPLRSAWLGLSSMRMATSVWWTVRHRGEGRVAGRAAGGSRPRRRRSTKRDIGWRTSEIAAPGMHHGRPVVAAHGVERDANF